MTTDADRALRVIEGIATYLRCAGDSDLVFDHVLHLLQQDGFATDVLPELPLELDACPNCGCTDVEGTAWINLNTGVPTSSEPPDSDVWCPQCDRHWTGTKKTFTPCPFRSNPPDCGHETVQADCPACHHDDDVEDDDNKDPPHERPG